MTEQCTIEKIVRVLSNLQSELNDKTPPNKPTVNNNGQHNERQNEDKKHSWWVWLRERAKKACKMKNGASNQANDSGDSQGGSSRRSIGKDEEDGDLEILKLQSDVRQMKAAFENLTKFQTHVNMSLERELRVDKVKAILNKTDSIKSRSHDIKEIRRKIFNLKCQIPSLLYKQSSTGLSITDSQTGEDNSNINENGSDIFLPGLHFSQDFKDSSDFEEVVEKFMVLEFTQKLCLLSFAVFPENKEVKKTMLMYWWIGEGFITCDHSENLVTNILKDFSRKGLLEPVKDERKLEPSSYKMEPHVHSAVICLATSMGLFDLYTSHGKLTMKKSEKKNVCLVKGSSLLRHAKTSVTELESLKTVFNSSERYPDFTFKWFPKMNSLRVLYLGRWERTARRHIEVESTEFSKDMKDLKNLRLVSFQGISRIEKLENPICALKKLVILDLRACYNLEGLPSDIGLLQNLIYLDVSECYMLDRMPKGIKDLLNLQVLKGFVISQSDDEKNCAVKNLLNLKKLSITVNKYLFKVENLMESLKALERLESLKIAWGATNENENQRVHSTEEKHKCLKDEQVHQKGHKSEEKKEDEINKNANIEEGNKGEEVKAGSYQEANQTIQKNPDKRKAGLKEGKKQDEVDAEKSKSDNSIEEVRKASPSRESTEAIQKKPDEKSKVENKGDADKEKDGLEKVLNQGEVSADKSKSENGIEEVKKASPSWESTDTIQEKQDEKSKVEKEGNGEEEKAKLVEGKKQSEVNAEKSKSDNGIEGVKKVSPFRELTDTVQKKPHDKSKVEKEGNGEEGKADLEEGKNQGEVSSEKSKSDNSIEGVKKVSPSQGSTNTIQKKPDDNNKVENKEDGDKGKSDQVEGKKQNEVEAESSKSDNGVEEVKKANLLRESTYMIQKEPDDHQACKKQEEIGHGEKENVNLEQVKKKDEIEEERSKSGKVIEEDEKTSPLQESKNSMQSKPNDHKEHSKVQEKGDGEKNMAGFMKLDGGEAKTQKSHKNKKFGKKVTSLENSKAFMQKKQDELEKVNQETTTIDTYKLPISLKKLELECFPENDPPSWLNPKNLGEITKLSIKGGMLSRISDETENKCLVKIVRLKYLHEFKAEWKDLQTLFPEMELLEKYQCPKVSFCPTDGNGIWRTKNKNKRHH